MADERQTFAQQENLISLLAHDAKQGKIIAQLVRPELFEGEYTVVAERLLDYWKQYKEPPAAHTADLFADILEDKRNRKAATYERIIKDMKALAPRVNQRYVMDSLKRFTRFQRFKDVTMKTAELLESNNLNTLAEIEAQWNEVLRAREFNFDPGLDLYRGVPDVIAALELQHSEFRMGIRHIDERNVVPARGQVMLFIAPTGRGKSWFLIHAGKAALLQRMNVMHFSLEMSEAQTAQRYYQSLFAIPKRADKFDIPRIVYEKGTDRNEISRVKLIEAKYDYAINDSDIVKKLRADMVPFEKALRRIRIKRFPPRSVTVNDLRAYLDVLEDIEGFIPDMIILDYIGVMKTNVTNHRLEQGRIMEDFRALLIERNAAGVTAAQGNRQSADARTVKSTHVAEDWSLIATSDTALSYSQTFAEKQVGLARLFVDKNRDDEDKFGVVITQSYRTGQFALQSARLDSEYWNLPELRDDDDAEHDGNKPRGD